MSDLRQRKGWTPYPFLATEQDYSPRIHWVMASLLLITAMVVLLTVVILAVFGIIVSFRTGGVFAVVPLLFPEQG